jgi:hypothetical protein
MVLRGLFLRGLEMTALGAPVQRRLDSPARYRDRGCIASRHEQLKSASVEVDEIIYHHGSGDWSAELSASRGAKPVVRASPSTGFLFPSDQ